MRRPLTLGSLFDGIGGFPLAGKLAGMRPVWASEIEPFPIRVTEKRLPGMKHYGNIFSLRGAGLEPVDVVTFGSPCQDLSIAGKREGLGGGRSSLFFEAVRIIREMREATDGKYPRWAVWENVPGALSSHDGEDFRQVLESLIRIRYGGGRGRDDHFRLACKIEQTLGGVAGRYRREQCRLGLREYRCGEKIRRHHDRQSLDSEQPVPIVISVAYV